MGVNSTVQTPGGIEWNVQGANAPQVWAMGYKGQGMVVAGADTDVQWDHTALKSHYGLGNQVGVAPGAKWMACRNMDQHGVGSPAQYIECFDWLIGGGIRSSSCRDF
jgi:subtilisin family serine protease